ncbi:putative RNA polymerase sigma factor [Rhodococcoides trifolii]|uniref:RNA polymerase sigma factor n=1 Tax=Rhodococcoides trifolii TaxID=908250 RepID=A0A917G2X7_9NOCA|nr:sigma-70 family RNA polymerase sigma factor [Rhodococcus trifolii]GGG20094.1 putative RNA polymerase sigma factor [Rhodococcus trifolii]
MTDDHADSADLPVSDRVLLDLSAAGDRTSFEQLVRRHGPSLTRYARRMLRDEGDVSEVVQDTFVVAWKQSSSFRGESTVRTWLFSICSRKIVDSRRVKRAQPMPDWLLEPAHVGRALDPHVFASNQEFVSALEKALAELPPRQRASWVLREIEGMTFPQIGVALSLSADGVRGHHLRARNALSLRMARWK